MNSIVKKTVSIVLAFFLIAAFSISAFAEESAVIDAEDEEGFSIEELPEFGEGDELTFPEEETSVPESTPEPTTAPEPAEESSIQEESHSKSQPEENQEKSAPASEPEQESVPEKNNHWLIIPLAAFLVIGGVTILLMMKRDPSDRKRKDR